MLQHDISCWREDHLTQRSVVSGHQPEVRKLHQILQAAGALELKEQHFMKDKEAIQTIFMFA